jgi:PAS domain S-box-containing protein
MTYDYHPLILRQLKRAGIDSSAIQSLPASYLSVIKKVSETYYQNDRDRYMQERMMDISSQEMRSLNQQLQIEKDKLQSLASDGICFIDKAWQFQSLNQEGERLCGFSAKQGIGKPIDKVFSFSTFEHGQGIDFKKIIQQVENNQVFRCERGYIRPFFSRAFISAYAFNPIMQEGKFNGVILVFHDISKQVEIEKQLEQAKNNAESIAAAKSQFLAAISHEIRTPMNGIIGTQQILLKTKLDKKQKLHVQTCFDSAQSLLRIIDDVLDFSRMESGKLTIEYQDIDLPKEIERGQRLLASQCQAKHINLQVDVDASISHHLRGDAVRFCQILTNLIGNAIKFTPPHGTIQLTASNKEKTLTHQLVYFQVIDSGIGIPKGVQRDIFQPFIQADASTTRKYGGTGLGLAITKQLIEQMGGNIQVNSTPGEGTTFSFHIPFKLSTQPSSMTTTTVITEVTPSAALNAKVLLVEDNLVNCMVTQEMLEDFGYAVEIAHDGQQAFDRFVQEDFDIILMDCQMPNIDGYTATELIRQHESTNQLSPTKIIALTANAFHTDRERCLQCGMNDYLSKPFRLEQLKNMLSKHL